jgi:metal-dependent hydrolase (beta-lactamase superfamily II)
MRVDFGAVEALVLSHGHWDHGGGVLEAVRRAVVLRLMRAASGRDCWIIEFCV